MSVQKKKSKNSPAWANVHVVGGDPCLCRFYVNGLVEDLNAASRRYDKSDSISAIRNSLTAFVFGDVPDAIILSDPTADQLKACLLIIEDNKLSASALIVVTPGDSLDARMSFAQQANKLANVTYMAPIEADDRQSLIAHLEEWEAGTRQKLNPEPRNWLLAHAPTRVVKIKTSKGKADAEVYDLEWLENELDKVIVVKEHEGGIIETADLEYLVQFDQGVDIWSFVAAASKGDASKTLDMLNKLTQFQSSQGALMVLLSQLEFLLGVRSALNQRCIQAEDIAVAMSLKSYLGQYLSYDWQPILSSTEPTAVNVWRIKKALENKISSSAQLSNQYQAVISAIRDLRSGLPESIVFPYLALALSGSHAYQEPMKQVF